VAATALLLVAAVIGAAAAAQVAPKTVAPQAAVLVERIDTLGPVWSLAALKSGLALGELPQRLVVASTTGKPLKEFDVGGLPLSIATGAFKRGGPEVVVVAAQDSGGNIYCLANEAAGLRLLWKFSARNPFLSVAIGDVDGDGSAEVAAGSYAGLVCVIDSAGKLRWSAETDEASSVGAVAIGDLDGDGKGDVVAGTSDSGVFAFSGRGKPLWRLNTKLPGAKMRKEEMLWLRSVAVADLDGDGRSEVLCGSRPHGLVTAIAGDGRPLWRKNFPEAVGRWSTALVEPLDLTGDGKPEIVCLLHGVILKGGKGNSPLMVLDAQGRLLSESYPQVALVCLGSADMNADGRRELLLGSPTRGRGFYKVSYPAGLAPISLPRPKDNLDDLAAAVARMTPRPAPQTPPARPIQVLFPMRFRDIEKRAVPLGRYLKGFEGPGLEFCLMVTSVWEEKGKVRDGYRPPTSARKQGRNLFSREQIVASAKYLEAQKLPFFVQAAKITLPNMRAATCEAILSAAPNYCRGFLVNENAPTRVAKFDAYVRWAEQVMDACHRHGDKKFIMDEYLNFWGTVPANPSWLAALFKPAYRNVAVPMYKTTQLVAPEQMQGMILGLWKAGVVAEWGYCSEDDAWKWASVFMNPPHDVILRMEVMAAALGATYFRIEENREFIEPRGAGYALEEGTPRHRGLFHELVRKGALRPAQDASELVVSPVVLKKAVGGLSKHSFRHSEYWQHVYEGRGLWDHGTLLQTVRPDYPFAYLSQMRYGYDGLFPETPYGVLTILPGSLEAKMPGAKAAWMLSDDSAQGPGGQTVPRAKVQGALLASFQGAAAELPLRAEGCLSIVRRGEGGYRVYLIEPGHFDIRDREVCLRFARPEGVAAVTDVISGKKLEITDKCVKVTIPAGAFRILEVRLKGQA
jgi:hypothetical protein